MAEKGQLAKLIESNFFKQTLWVARDKNHDLYLFSNEEPIRNTKGEWFTRSQNSDTLKIDGDLYPELTWDDAAFEIEINLAPKELFGFAELVFIKHLINTLEDVYKVGDYELTLVESIKGKLDLFIKEEKTEYVTQDSRR